MKTAQQLRTLLYCLNNSEIQYSETGRDHRHFVKYYDGKRIYITRREYEVIKDEIDFIQDNKSLVYMFNQLSKELNDDSIKYFLVRKPRVS